MSDNQTVIIQHTTNVRSAGLEPNAISLVVSDPLDAAKFAARRLRQAGFKAEVVEGVIPEIASKFVLVTSTAFHGFVICFRLHALAMGERLGLCRLDDLADGASKPA
jgi:hypothetical protein